MSKFLLTGLTCLTLCATSSAQHLKIAVIGSSTAVGTGASIPDSSWVNLTQAYFKSLHEIDTIYNMALGGTFTGDGVDTIPYALARNPDLVLVSYVSNDAAGDIAVPVTMQNLRTIYQAVINAGKVCYITTPHPRNFLNGSQNIKQVAVRDSTLLEFPGFTLDFWDVLVAANSDTLNPIYNSGDGVHVNNAGHQQLFQIVKNANILSSLVPLAVITDSFTAVPQQQDVLLSWTSQVAGPVDFVIQRSEDGNSFAAIGQENAADNQPGTHYSWKDASPSSGRSYYRLQTTTNGSPSFSPVVSLLRTVEDWTLSSIYVQPGGAQLTAEIQSARSRNITLSVIDAGGKTLIHKAGQISAPASQLTLSLNGLAQGQYYLRIDADDGRIATKAFLKW